MPAFVHCGHGLTLQEDPDGDPVRDQQQGYDERGKEVGGSQLPRQEPGTIRLIESIEEIG